MDQVTRPGRASLPPALLAPIGLGALLALAGGLWDDAWHTERGRDSFLIAPHLAIYCGVSAVGAGVALWLALAARAVGLRAALRRPGIALAAASVAVTLAAAPVDNLWHVAFGRDAVIFSPPHVLGIVGTGSLAAALLLELAATPARWARHAEGPLSGLLLAAFAFLVIEYETDVPQFAAVWYLPVLALGAGYALALARRLGAGALPAARAAAWQLAFVAGASLLVLSQGFDAPRLPLLLAPALAIDLGVRRGLRAGARAALAALALFAAYVPVGALVGHGVVLDAGDVVVGLPLAWLAFAATAALVGELPRRPPAGAALGVAAAALLALALALPVAALAHDPGQGADAGTIDLRVESAGGWALVVARGAPDFGGSGSAVARRAGVTHRGPLRRDRAGRYVGRVRLGARGRWFVYVELRRGDGRVVEAWLPVTDGPGGRPVHDPARFAYVSERRASSTVKWLAGAALYALVAAYLVVVAALARRAQPWRAANETIERSISHSTGARSSV